jgi:hypothetical protein
MSFSLGVYNMNILAVVSIILSVNGHHEIKTIERSYTNYSINECEYVYNPETLYKIKSIIEQETGNTTVSHISIECKRI